MNQEIKKSWRKRKITLSRLRRRFLKNIWLARILVLSLVIVSGCFLILLASLIFKNSQLGGLMRTLQAFVFTPQSQINLHQGRTNVLILGKSGPGHDSPDLTDTLIFASVSHQQPEVVLISSPRDIWIPALRAKLNSAYYWGNQKESGGGLVLAKSTVEEILGEPVHYALVIDFAAFEDVINVLGGIEVEVKEGFIDERFPIPGKENDDCGGDPEYGCRYETIEFMAGKQIMDGEQALKFVRSRNAEGPQGTDLARAARQQLILTAIKAKALSWQTLTNPRKMTQVFQALSRHTETDLQAPAAAILLRRLLQSKKTSSFLLPEDLLDNPPISARYDYLYVFIPRAGDWSEVHQWVDSILKN